jgi:predicted DsbA family dithiol-disulfide isomerase
VTGSAGGEKLSSSTRQDLAAVIANWALVLGALILSGSILWRQFRPAESPRVRSHQEPVHIENWREYGLVGHRIGSASAPVTIVEFSDFECPVCRSFTVGALRAIRAEYGERIALVFRHWPLPYHRMAYPAARASECAGVQQRFGEFHDLVFSKQDSLGLKSFAEFAWDAGIRDTAAFVRCTKSSARVASIEVDIRAAVALKGTGTPLILINGLLLPGAPDSSQLARYVSEALRKATSEESSDQ